MLIANMLIDMIDCEPTPVSCTELSHEHEDHANPPEQASVYLCAPVDACPSAPQPGEHRAPVRAQGQSADIGLAPEINKGAGPRSWPVGGTDEWPRGLQDAGSRCVNGPSRSSVCPGGIAPGTLQSGLASITRTVRSDPHIGDRCRRLLRPWGLQRWVVAWPQRNDGSGRTSFFARAPPGR